MQKFTFSEKKDVLIPNSPVFRPPLDSKGNVLSGDTLLRMYGRIITNFEQKYKQPVPIEDQKFIGWIKQAVKKLDEGKSSDEIFRSTLVGVGTL